jgi:hypothetical protein
LIQASLQALKIFHQEGRFMHPYRSLLDGLTYQTKNGDAAAAIQLQRELGPTLVVMVRQTMTPGGAKTPMDRRIRAEARRRGLCTANERSAERELLIREVAESVCRGYVAELRLPPRQSLPMAETLGFGRDPSVAISQ